MLPMEARRLAIFLVIFILIEVSINEFRSIRTITKLNNEQRRRNQSAHLARRTPLVLPAADGRGAGPGASAA